MILKQWGCLPIGKIKEWKKVGFSCSVSLNPKCANEQFGRCHIATLLSTLVTLALIVVVIAKQIPFVPNVNFWLKDSSTLKSFEICRNGKCISLVFKILFLEVYPYFRFLCRSLFSPFEFECVNDNFDRHTNRFENSRVRNVKNQKRKKKVSLLLVTKDWKIFKRNWKFHLWARLQLFRGSSKTVVEPSMNDCFGVDFSKRAFTTSTNCRWFVFSGPSGSPRHPAGHVGRAVQQVDHQVPTPAGRRRRW